jgi:phosphate transport system permease protein
MSAGRSRRPLGASLNQFFRRKTGRRSIGDWIFLGIVAFAALLLAVMAAVLVGVLVQSSWPSLTRYGIGFLWGPVWNSNTKYNIFGALPFVEGTLVTSFLGLLLALPVSIGVAIFLSEQAPAWVRTPLGAVVDLLAAVPSVVFGFWGLYVLVPIMQHTVEPEMQVVLGSSALFGGTTPGTGIFTAGVVLAIMIIPTISAVSREVLLAVPQSQREAALSVGATKWEAIRIGVLKYSRAGILGAVILGLGRAIGETIAVTMVIGNRDGTFTSLFAQGQTMASLIANEFLDPTSPIDKSALIEIGLLLLVVTIMVNIVARGLIWRLTKGGR